jgi:excisionase family DNA binding protein
MLGHARSSTDPGVIAPALLSIQQAAQRVGLKHLAIRRAIQRGELPAMKLCSRIRIDPADLERWILQRRVPPFRDGRSRGAESESV